MPIYRPIGVCGTLLVGGQIKFLHRDGWGLYVRDKLSFHNLHATLGVTATERLNSDVEGLSTNILLAPTATIFCPEQVAEYFLLGGVRVADYNPNTNATRLLIYAEDLAWAAWFNDDGVVLSEPSFASEQINFKIDRYDAATNQYVEIYDSETSANADSLYVADVTWGDGVTRRSLVDAAPPVDAWAHYRARPTATVVKGGLTCGWSEPDPKRHIAVWRGTSPPQVVYYYRGSSSGSFANKDDWSLTPDKVVRIDAPPTTKDNKFVLN